MKQQKEKENKEEVNTDTIISSQAQKWAPVLRFGILLLISIVAFLCRIFSVIRYESIIHEFDPWFNYRTTLHIEREGLYSLWNWFDSESWYPLGRAVGATVYPGLMSTSYIIYWILQQLSFTVEIRNICVFMAPIFSALTSIAAYLLTIEATKKTETGLFAALFIAISPTYLSRSVAGSYDNEAVAIFAMVFTFYVFIKACNTGAILWGTISAMALFYMISTWGGYAFIINIIPIFVVFQLISGNFNMKIYVAYSIFYLIGTFYAMLIPFVSYQAIHSSEHMASHCVFIFIQLYFFVQWIKQYITQSAFQILTRFFIISLLLILVVAFILLTLTGQSKWSGRSMTLLDPTFASKYIPIIASVSEHQATTWPSYFFDIHYIVIFAPIGMYYCFKNPTNGTTFIAIYVVLAVYFSSVMVRLLLVLGPGACMMAAIGISKLIQFLIDSIKNFFASEKQQPKNKKKKFYATFDVALIGIGLIIYLVCIYTFHGINAGAEAYSSPSVIMASRDKQGNKVIIDDYREAYYWLRQNSREDAKIMSWWDYGYQITGFSNRTVLVDNNTWNNTHIATVGLAMSSNEEEAYQICEKLDVDYVLVIFGGLAYYSGDDINKFLWMIRIAGGVYPHIKEEDFYSQGQYRIDSGASETMKNSLMYKLSYYRFGEVSTQYGKPAGYDTVRNSQVGNLNIKLNRFEEAFTSENWIVRIYKVKNRMSRDGLEVKSKDLQKFPNNITTYLQDTDMFKNYKYAYKIIEKAKKF